MALETQYCCHRTRPTNSLTECKVVAYGQCAAEHKGNSGYFCFDHLEQCSVCGGMYCPIDLKSHECTDIERAA